MGPGHDRLVLKHLASKDRAARFYERNGFTVLRRDGINPDIGESERSPTLRRGDHRRAGARNWVSLEAPAVEYEQGEPEERPTTVFVKLTRDDREQLAGVITRRSGSRRRPVTPTSDTTTTPGMIAISRRIGGT